MQDDGVKIAGPQPITFPTDANIPVSVGDSHARSDSLPSEEIEGKNMLTMSSMPSCCALYAHMLNADIFQADGVVLLTPEHTVGNVGTHGRLKWHHQLSIMLFGLVPSLNTMMYTFDVPLTDLSILSYECAGISRMTLGNGPLPLEASTPPHAPDSKPGLPTRRSKPSFDGSNGHRAGGNAHKPPGGRGECYLVSLLICSLLQDTADVQAVEHQIVA